MSKDKENFRDSLRKHNQQKQREKLTPEERMDFGLAKLERVFLELGNKQNRYLFYCPDIPFALTTVKAIYDFSRRLNKAGFRTVILHEIKPFKPKWLPEEWTEDVTIDYLSKKKQSTGKQTNPNYQFRPSDTIIIPDGFWTVMEGFKEIKGVQKVVLALGPGGIATAGTGLNTHGQEWSHLGFTDVICMSEGLKSDYESLWPHLNYHVLNWSIDTELFAPLPVNEVHPVIALAVRSREDAQSIINIFYHRYPFLQMFQFKVLKRLDIEQYADTLKHCCCMVFVDSKAGFPAPPLEAIACSVPTIALYGRGMDHLAEQEGITWIEHDDNFIITEEIASFCLKWLTIPNLQIKDRAILDSFAGDVVDAKLKETFGVLQDNLKQKFTAIKKGVEGGHLSDEAIAADAPVSDESLEDQQNPKMTVVKDEN